MTSSTLVLDGSSLTPVEEDAVTGLALDPIGKDRSNRACARIKLHISRLTPQEIAELDVRTIGGNVLKMKQTVAYEGNGLIFEITARKDVRFYLHHDRLGDSNPVTVSLEGNKEYRMEAWNELTVPVTIVCMTPGAEVFLDEIYQGVIGHDHMLTLQGVSGGEHDLRLVHGTAEAYEHISVSADVVSFNVELQNSELLYGTLTFKLVPFEASVEIDGETLTSDDGVISRRTRSGSYNYRVFAEGYHDKSGTVTVDTTSVSRHIVLDRMIARLTVDAPENAKMWMNGQQKGKGPLTEEVAPGDYMVKIKLPGHYPHTEAVTVTPEMTSHLVDLTRSSVPYEKNLLAMASVGVYPSISYGVMLGYVKTVGGYVKFRSNFESTKGVYNATSSLDIETGGYFWPSGAKAESIMNVSGGMLIRAARFLYPYFGAGYGERKVMWQDAGGKWADITDYTYTGVSAEAGLVFKFGPIALSAGVSSTAFKYTSAEVGLGMMF